MTKIKQIPTPEIDEQRKVLATLVRSIPMMIEYQTEIAKYRKATFDIHVRAGFTPEQAVIIVKDLP